MKQIDGRERVELTNAMVILENHGIVDHANFFTDNKDNDVWAYVIGNKSIRINQRDKNTYEVEVVTHGE